MLIDFNEMKELCIENMNNGSGRVNSKMFMNENGKVILCRISQGASIGEHIQKSGNDINYVISGVGKAICDGKEEQLYKGVCHYCPKNSVHSIINTGDEDLVLFTVVDG